MEDLVDLVHNTRELDRVLGIDSIDLIGINNRDLEIFQVEINNTVELLKGERGRTVFERNILVVGESGLFTPQDIALLQNAGVEAVGVGGALPTYWALPRALRTPTYRLLTSQFLSNGFEISNNFTAFASPPPPSPASMEKIPFGFQRGVEACTTQALPNIFYMFLLGDESMSMNLLGAGYSMFYNSLLLYIVRRS
ncbi:hypothetical protein GOP47_0000936 [Adiantum capillus-veneris]|uniref:indole-3-glycerol-phosphate synthase n=1 Tax=Adiantum capillus-veneris TaxID=13818 RepID=A0A9D4VEG0_ADICA|nr:hypothetical protein GOP47_0000936 [Adiantum capillus-veneris]